jgi:hypothetical protein
LHAARALPTSSFSDPRTLWRCRFGVELEDQQLLVLNAVALFVALKIILTLVGGGGGTVLELHGYQKAYLSTMASAQGLGDEAAALQSVVEKAMADAAFAKTLFDSEFHCVHCGSKNPPEWIKSAMGKEPRSLTGSLSAEALAFLSSSQLVAVGPPGPKKALKPEDPKRTNAGKAARICVDWAIKEYGDDGKGKGR